MKCKSEFRVIKNMVYDDMEGSCQEGYIVVDQHYDGDRNCEYYAQVWSRSIGKTVIKALQKSER